MPLNRDVFAELRTPHYRVLARVRRKGAAVNKLCLAWAAIMLLGCTGSVAEDAGSLNGTAAGNDSGGSNGMQPGGGSAPDGSNGAAGSNASSNGGVSSNGGATSNGGASSNGGVTSNGGNCSTPAPILPTTVQSLLMNRCATCHGPTPLLPNLPSLTDYANLTAPSKSDPTKTNAVVSLARLQSTTMPMPPAPGAPATAAEIAALQDFITQGYPKPAPVCTDGSGGSGGSGGMAGGGGTAGSTTMDPLFAPPTCTSMTSWTGGNRESASMNPGMACIACHSKGEGPSFSIAGTLYPTGHEPDRCNSSVGTAGARIVIVGADGQQVTLEPNSVGNFSARSAVKLPYQAKVTYQGRERLMLTAQTSGDCNACHTQNGSMNAPGRITVP